MRKKGNHKNKNQINIAAKSFVYSLKGYRLRYPLFLNDYRLGIPRRLWSISFCIYMALSARLMRSSKRLFISVVVEEPMAMLKVSSKILMFYI